VGVPLHVVELNQPHITELYACRLVLVRPDGHVAWRADAEPEDARAVIDVVRGARSYASLSLRQPDQEPDAAADGAARPGQSSRR
jgi:hypothetical protein